MVKYSSKDVAKAIFFGLGYFIIGGLIPLATKGVIFIISELAPQFQGLSMDFEPRTVEWLIFVGLISGIAGFFEKLYEKPHPTGAGVFGIIRHIVGVINVILYYNLMLSIKISLPTTFNNFGIDPTSTFPEI